jgi:hypothetical protein
MEIDAPKKKREIVESISQGNMRHFAIMLLLKA